MNIGKSIARQRIVKGYTQAHLAAKAGMQAAYISKMEAGQHEPSLRTLERLAKALETTALRLVEDA